MIVSMHSNVWTLINDNKIHLVRHTDTHTTSNQKPVLRVHPCEDLKYMYQTDDYEMYKAMCIGFPITHHDNIELRVEERFVLLARAFPYWSLLS